MFASTVFPVYLLTHAVTQDRVAALFAAVLAVAVPWLGMTATLMTEPIAYPAFAWAILAMTRAVERRTPAADAFAIVAIAVATLARTQLAVLGVAFLAAVASSRYAARIGGPSCARRCAATSCCSSSPCSGRSS